jgi:hypothetical protein
LAWRNAVLKQMTDDELYERAAETLLATWEAYARGSRAARLVHEDGVAIGVFPAEPERDIYNNALLTRGLSADRVARAAEAVERAYGDAGIGEFAIWVRETDEAARAELEARGYGVTERSRAMGMTLDDRPRPDSTVSISEASWAEHLGVLGVPPALLAGLTPSPFHVLAARGTGRPLATGMSLDHHGDCGINNVVTALLARRRGLGTAITVRLVLDAAARGCSTATLFSSPVAEGVYRSVGFRDLGAILEYSPGA